MLLSGCSSTPAPSPTASPVVLEIGGLAGVSGAALTSLRSTPIAGLEVQWLQYSDAPGMMSALGAGSNDAVLIGAEEMTSVPNLEVLKVFVVTTGDGSYTEVLAFKASSPEAEQLRRIARQLSSEQTLQTLTQAGYTVSASK